jgi:ribosomal protein S18 acetylase RimI-like enzyme
MNQENKKHVIKILTESFYNNKSTNFVIKQDRKKRKRLETLIKYSIFHGEKWGEVYLSEDKSSCYITIDKGNIKPSLRSILWDIRLIFSCIGITNVARVLKRESIIKSKHPKDHFVHLWYIGVLPSKQGSGRGTKMMQSIINQSKLKNQKIYLETSTERNFQFYKQLGFIEETSFEELGYPLKMFKYQ